MVPAISQATDNLSVFHAYNCMSCMSIGLCMIISYCWMLMLMVHSDGLVKMCVLIILIKQLICAFSVRSDMVYKYSFFRHSRTPDENTSCHALKWRQCHGVLIYLDDRTLIDVTKLMSLAKLELETYSLKTSPRLRGQNDLSSQSAYAIAADVVSRALTHSI